MDQPAEISGGSYMTNHLTNFNGNNFYPACAMTSSINNAKPYLEIVEEPAHKPFRFRYESEMHGTHGSLMGINSKKTKQTYPTVALRNFNFKSKAYIYYTLYQVQSEGRFKRSPHSHKLVIRKGKREELDPHVIEVSILLDLIQHGSVQEIKELVIILMKFKLKDVLHSLNDLDQNCLHILVLGAHYKLLKIFLSLGVDVNQVDAFGDTPLHLAVGRNEDKLVKELLEGAENLELNKINDKGQSPLHIAVSQNNLATTKLLVERGADLYKKVPQSGNSALQLAVSRTDVSVPLITFLIERDGNILNEENNAGMNVLQAAVSAKQPENLIKLLSQCYDESYSFAEEKDDDSSSESENEEIFSKLFDAQCFRKLCKIFNSADKWKNVLIIAEEEHKIDSWLDEPNPAKNVLFHLEITGKNIDDLLEFFDLLDEEEATVAVNEMLVRKFGE